MLEGKPGVLLQRENQVRARAVAFSASGGASRSAVFWVRKPFPWASPPHPTPASCSNGQTLSGPLGVLWSFPIWLGQRETQQTVEKVLKADLIQSVNTDSRGKSWSSSIPKWARGSERFKGRMRGRGLRRGSSEKPQSWSVERQASRVCQRAVTEVRMGPRTQSGRQKPYPSCLHFKGMAPSLWQTLWALRTIFTIASPFKWML